MTGASGAPAASDETLVEHAREGDMAAFEELVMRYADRLFASLRRCGLDHAEAQEVAQETFLRAWRSLARFEGRSSFFTWLYRIGFNEAQRWLARRPAAGIVVSSELQPVDEVPDNRPGPATRAETDQLRAALGRALRELPFDLRAPVVLRDVEVSRRDRPPRSSTSARPRSRAGCTAAEWRCAGCSRRGSRRPEPLAADPGPSSRNPNGSGHGYAGREERRAVARSADARAVRSAQAQRHRAAVLRRLRAHQRRRHLPLRGVRYGAVLF